VGFRAPACVGQDENLIVDWGSYFSCPPHSRSLSDFVITAYN